MTSTIALNKLCLILDPDASPKLSRLRDAELSGGLLPGEIAVLKDSAMNFVLRRAMILLLLTFSPAPGLCAAVMLSRDLDLPQTVLSDTRTEVKLPEISGSYRAGGTLSVYPWDGNGKISVRVTLMLIAALLIWGKSQIKPDPRLNVFNRNKTTTVFYYSLVNSCVVRLTLRGFTSNLFY